MIHSIKCDTLPFESIWNRLKKSEFRFNDRNYQVGDDLVIIEYNRITEKYSGKYIQAKILHIEKGYGIPEDYVVLSIGNIETFVN